MYADLRLLRNLFLPRVNRSWRDRGLKRVSPQR
jgi:hypothetical protein